MNSIASSKEKFGQNALNLRTDNNQNIDYLISILILIPKSQRWAFNAAIYSMGIMKFDQKYAKFVLWVIKKLRGNAGVISFFQIMEKKSPALSQLLFYRALMHIQFGNNKANRNGVCGLSQQELDQVCAFCQQFLPSLMEEDL